MKKQSTKILGVVAALLLSGCASQNPAPIDGLRPDGSFGPLQGTIQTGRLHDTTLNGSHIPQIGNFRSQVYNIDQYTPQQQQEMLSFLSQMYADSCNTVNFAFDSSVLSNRAKNCLDRTAAYLVRYNQPIRLEGHTDPTGSQKYNLNLGQFRAGTAQQYLSRQGVSKSQMCTVSYGKSQPIVAPSQLYAEMCGGNFSQSCKSRARQQAYDQDRRVEVKFGQTCG